MNIERVKRQICLFVSIISLVSDMYLVVEQTDTCFLWETAESNMGSESVSMISSENTIAALDSSCTGELLGQRGIISIQPAVRRSVGGLRIKRIQALSFASLFLVVLILFQMAVDHYCFFSKNYHAAVIQYIHHKDGKKRNNHRTFNVFSRGLGLMERTSCSGR